MYGSQCSFFHFSEGMRYMKNHISDKVPLACECREDECRYLEPNVAFCLKKNGACGAGEQLDERGGRWEGCPVSRIQIDG